MSDPTARALSLLALLQTHRYWSGVELADRLGVSARTVRRDVDRLRELGYRVDAAPGVAGGYQLVAGSAVPPLLVDEDEAVALSVGMRAAAGSAIEGIDETTVRLLAKLDQVLPDRLRRRVEALHSNVEVLRWAPSVMVSAAALTVLAQGCRDREEMRFGYRRRDGEESSRLVQPYQLVSAGQRWYLVAWDCRREDWRTFRVDRMVEPRLAGARFEPLSLPAESAADFVAAGLRAATEQHEAVVVLGGDPDEIERLAHWFRGDLTALGEGRTRMRVTAESLEWLAGMIAILSTSFTVDVVEAPDEVRARLSAAADRLRTVG
ncbi:MAG: transcriptional regulator [Acidimicrobiaceae bacterium]|nr:transcriptional regulator [Acidimicrobiaceae bacterium]